MSAITEDTDFIKNYGNLSKKSILETLDLFDDQRKTAEKLVNGGREAVLKDIDSKYLTFVEKLFDYSKNIKDINLAKIFGGTHFDYTKGKAITVWGIGGSNNYGKIVNFKDVKRAEILLIGNLLFGNPEVAETVLCTKRQVEHGLYSN